MIMLLYSFKQTEIKGEPSEFLQRKEKDCRQGSKEKYFMINKRYNQSLKNNK